MELGQWEKKKRTIGEEYNLTCLTNRQKLWRELAHNADKFNCVIRDVKILGVLKQRCQGEDMGVIMVDIHVKTPSRHACQCA